MPPDGSGASSAGSPDGASCAYRAQIEDAEDGDSQVLTRQGRGGYLYTFADDAGTTIDPPTSGFEVSAGGVDGGQALHMTGTIAAAGDVYAGMGLSFTDPMGGYDASQYRGIAFAARGTSGASTAVRLKVPDAATAPEGRACSECYNDFGVDFQITEEWTRYVVDFADLEQEDGWGDPRPAQVDTQRLFGIQWQATAAGQPFDLWVDDVTFLGCPSDPS